MIPPPSCIHTLHPHGPDLSREAKSAPLRISSWHLWPWSLHPINAAAPRSSSQPITPITQDKNTPQQPKKKEKRGILGKEDRTGINPTLPNPPLLSLGRIFPPRCEGRGRATTPETRSKSLPKEPSWMSLFPVGRQKESGKKPPVLGAKRRRGERSADGVEISSLLLICQAFPSP